MRQALVWLVLAGCVGCGAKPVADARAPIAPPAPAPADASVAPVVVESAAPPAPPAPPGFEAVEAPPGGKLVRVATTPTGDAALTVDAADETRLWPALDGARAPLVVDLPPARAFALQRTSAGFATVLLVDGGALHVRLDAQGHRLAVRELPELDGVAAIADGFVTWRGRHLAWLDAAGADGAVLDAPARVTAVATAEAGAVLTLATGAPRALAVPALALGGPAPRPAPPRVTPRLSDLAVPTPDGTRYLGYPYVATGLAPTGDGAVLVAGPPGRWLRLDAALAPAREIAPVMPPHDTATGLTSLGDRAWLVQSLRGVSLWREDDPAPAQLVLPRARLLEYDASSHLLLLVGNHLARYAPDRHAVEPVAFDAWGDAATTPHLLAPDLAHGAVLLLERFARDPTGVVHGEVRWVHDLAHPEAAVVWTGVDAWLVTHTRGGQVVIHQGNGYGTPWPLLADGQPAGEVPQAMTELAPDGTRYFERTAERHLELHDVAGHLAWSVKLPGADPATDFVPTWLDATHAILATAHGAAAIDLATGALAPARAGWGFELAAIPHAASGVGHPLAVDLAAGRDGRLGLTADLAFEALATDVAAASNTRVLWWGPVALDGAPVRCALLMNLDQTGSVVAAYLVQTAPDAVEVVAMTAWGFSHYQGPLPGTPPWGTELSAESFATTGHTRDRHELEIGSHWIHGSFASLAFTREGGRFVVTSEKWMERENNGHGFDTTGEDRTFPHGHRPLLADFEAHALVIAIAAPSTDPAALAAAIVALPFR